MNTEKQLREEIRSVLNSIFDDEFDKYMNEIKEDPILYDKIKKIKLINSKDEDTCEE